MEDLPIRTVLPDLLAALRTGSGAALVAPPGAGKTTAVAPALLDEEWCTGRIILLSPRRLAARAAAERISELMGAQVGGLVGYRTRLDSRASASTRILVVTEAIFVAMILEDQELGGTSAVLFDEAHERHLDSDLGLALALESQAVLRPDLRILVMSATIAGERFAALLGEGAPVIESEGRAFPLRVEWLGTRPEQRIEDQVASAVLHAWREEEGDILAFLPGLREIERVRERLAERLPQTPILPLHGQVAPAEQRAAIRRDREGRRRIVLATSIAETSVTLEGVSVVVDSGLSRRAEFDIAAGATHLVTRRASQAAAAQRAGRAARSGPGVAYRLWEEAGHAGREAYDPPEIFTTDLAPLALALAQWGVDDAGALPWLDPPPPAALAAARERLRGMGALDEAGRITAEGRQMAALPMAPWQAAMVLFGARYGEAPRAARLALLLQERGLGGPGEDLATRLDRWERDRSPRAEASRKLADAWARRARSLVESERDRKAPPSPAVLLAVALPDNLARRRDSTGESWLSAGGRGYMLDPASPLASAEWLVIGDAQGSARGARITAGLAVPFHEIAMWLGHRIEKRFFVRWNAETQTAEPVCERRLGAILISRAHDSSAERGEVTRLLLDHFRKTGLAALPLAPASLALLERARYARIEAFSEAALQADADGWLGDLAHKLNSLRDLDSQVLHRALLNRLDYARRQHLERAAPAEYLSPAGTTHPIDYAAEGGPAVDIRVQALFGLDTHPTVAGRPLRLRLTSPAGRPLQTTTDLPGFWRGTWADVRREMKGRYPKHRWPEQPWSEAPSLTTKNAFERS